MTAAWVLAGAWLAGAAAAGPLPGYVPSPARAPSFARQMTRLRAAAIPEAADLFERMEDGVVPQDQQAALQAGVMRAASFGPRAQLALVKTFERVAASDDDSAVVRAAAMDALGRAAPRLRSLDALREVASALTDAAHAQPGSRLAPFRVEALLGLSELSDHMPWIDRRTDELMVLTALDGARQAGSARENELAMLILYNLLQARGPEVVYRTPALAQRLDSDLLWPLAVDLPAYYADARHGGRSRYFLMGCLRWIAGSRELPDPAAAARIRGVLEHMARLDPEPSLKQLAGLYGEELQAGARP